MNAADAGAPADADLQRLRAALAGTAESPRPVADLRLPLTLGHLLSDKVVAGLRPAAVLVPLIMRDDGVHLLLTRRSELLRNHKGQISFPGGSRDSGDVSFAATALREAYEEVGLPPASVEIIGYLDDYPVLSGFRITPVVGIVGQVFAPALATAEVAEMFDLPLARVLAADAFEKKILDRDGITVPFFELNYGSYRIWGATAGILWELRTLLLQGDAA
ncbi:MAG: CoA pyrophosphatase [Nevskia sp.]|nr:CoA pyrophosphatase [Nevskia sp.]